MSKRVSYPEAQRVEKGTVLVDARGVLYVVTPPSAFDGGYNTKQVNLVLKSDMLAWRKQQAADLAYDIAKLEGAL